MRSCIFQSLLWAIIVVLLCPFGSHGRRIPLLDDCGQIPQSFTNRGAVSRNQLPWVATVYERTPARGLRYICTGALVHYDLVLVSAACLDIHRDPALYEVVLSPSHGDLAINAGDNTTILTDVSNVVVHHGYRADAGYIHNLAIMKLSYRRQPEPGQRLPVCIAMDEPQPTDVGQVIGSVNRYNGSASDLIATNLVVLDERKCIEITNDAPSRDQFCAIPTNPVVPLRRIGSGPFLIERDGRYYLEGLLSQGSLWDKYSPVFVTSVPWHLDWISGMVSSMSRA